MSLSSVLQNLGHVGSRSNISSVSYLSSKLPSSSTSSTSSTSSSRYFATLTVPAAVTNGCYPLDVDESMRKVLTQYHTIYPPLSGRSHASSTCTLPLINKSIGQVLASTTSNFGDRSALISSHQNIRWNYEELQNHVTSLAKSFLALGLRKGDRVGIWSENTAEWILTQYATAQVGLILVNLNPVYKHSELEYALNKVTCKALVFSESYKNNQFYQTILTTFPELASYPTSPATELQLEKVPSLKYLIKVGGSSLNAPGIHSFDSLLTFDEKDMASSLHSLYNDTTSIIECDDPINIQFTSGTTGFPKGATLSHRNIVNNGYFVGKNQEFTENDRVCIPVPLFHCFGMVMGSLGVVTHGASMVLPEGSFDPVATLRATADEKCTALYGVPTMFMSMLQQPEFESVQSTLKSNLRTGIMAGTTCPEVIMRRVIEDMGLRGMTVCYGMTETSPVSFQSTVHETLKNRVTTVGRISPHLECRIVNEDGHTVPVGARGEILVRGYSVMNGYWSGESVDREASLAGGLDKNGWMHTGDLGEMDEGGYLKIVGRLKDMLIRGGENIYPREIEEHLYTHPFISDAQVIGVPDEFMGEEAAVWVLKKKKELCIKTVATTATGDVNVNVDVDISVEYDNFNEESVRKYLALELANFKIPRYVIFVDSYPMTNSGKVQKYIMRNTMIDMIKNITLPLTADRLRNKKDEKSNKNGKNGENGQIDKKENEKKKDEEVKKVAVNNNL